MIFNLIIKFDIVYKNNYFFSFYQMNLKFKKEEIKRKINLRKQLKIQNLIQ